MVRKFYGELGFEKCSEDEAGNSVWKLNTAGYEKTTKPCDRSGELSMLFQSYISLLFFPLCLLGFWGLKRQKLLQLWLIAFPCGFTEQRESVLSVAAAGQYCMELCFFSRHRAWHWACYRACFRECYGARRVWMERDSSRKDFVRIELQEILHYFAFLNILMQYRLAGVR